MPSTVGVTQIIQRGRNASESSPAPMSPRQLRSIAAAPESHMFPG
ncbi:hypothetical protein [Corynebacterium bovis]|nr:hypothetical protein [Corynebacterium bovis]